MDVDELAAHVCGYCLRQDRPGGNGFTLLVCFSVCLRISSGSGSGKGKKSFKKAKAKAQVPDIAPLNMRSTCQRRFTIVEVVTDQHWL